MSRPHIELELREPTGLGLGAFDLFHVRQRIYEGDLRPNTQFLAADGEWRSLAEHPAFEEVFWLLGIDPNEDGRVKKRATFGGWRTDAAQQEQVQVASKEPRKGGLLGRFFGK
jgi:hypothetical protein